MTDMPMGEHTQENMELHIGAAFAGGAKLEEIVKAIRAALVRIFGEASDQFQALNDAMNALARGEELKPLEPQEQAKGPRPHPCPTSGPPRPPKSTRTAYAARVQRIRPQARSTIKQRRNRRRE